ncbi:MAG: phage holin family protein [Thermomonas sp.]|uniref:phage holin family protein n=1 Tax=Thermomonas sp. TaxID=1971895 RepID=UPI0039E5C064
MADTGDTPDKGTPGLREALHALGEDSRASLHAAGDTLKALRSLIAADFALARSALVRTLVFTAAAIAFGASAWLLLMAVSIAALQAAGLSWLAALLIAAALSIGLTIAAGILAMHHFAHTRMHATRRQLARFGLAEPSADENEDDEAEPPTPQADAP